MIELQRPKVEFAKSYMEFIHEMHKLGEKVWEGMLPKPEESLQSFVASLLAAEFSAVPPLVTQTTYWAILDNQVVGRIALRHCLNERLSEYGGHIGYEVRPNFRSKGIAKEMLKLLLQTPKAMEIGRLLLTCAPDNIASNKTIQANGGVLAKTAFVKNWNRETNYYWIEKTKGVE